MPISRHWQGPWSVHVNSKRGGSFAWCSPVHCRACPCAFHNSDSFVVGYRPQRGLSVRKGAGNVCPGCRENNGHVHKPQKGLCALCTVFIILQVPLLPTNVSAPNNSRRLDLSSDMQDVTIKPVRGRAGSCHHPLAVGEGAAGQESSRCGTGMAARGPRGGYESRRGFMG